VVGTTFRTLAENVEQGSRILLSDGLIELRVRQVDGDDVVCDIVNGGMLGENKGINLPGIMVRVPSLTEKIRLTWNSRSRTASTPSPSPSSAPRRTSALSATRIGLRRRNLDHRQAGKARGHRAIGRHSAGRGRHHGGGGDLGVEVPPEKVPAIQKHIIRRAAEYRKPVITPPRC